VVEWEEENRASTTEIKLDMSEKFMRLETTAAWKPTHVDKQSEAWKCKISGCQRKLSQLYFWITK